MSHLDIFNSIKNKEAHIKDTNNAIYKDLKELTKNFDDYYYCNIHHHSSNNIWFSIHFYVPVKHALFSLISVSLNVKNERWGINEHPSVDINISNHPMSVEYKLLHMYSDEVKNNFDELGLWSKDDYSHIIKQFSNFDKQHNNETLFTDFMKRSFQENINPYLKQIKDFKPTDTIVCIDEINKKFDLLVTSLETKSNMFEADNDMFEMVLEALKTHENKKMHHDLDMSLANKATGTRKKI